MLFIIRYTSAKAFCARSKRAKAEQADTLGSSKTAYRSRFQIRPWALISAVLRQFDLVIRQIGFLAIAASISFAQPKPAPEQEPKIDRLRTQKGAVLVRGSSKIGIAEGNLGASIIVEAIELTDASGGTKEDGIAITVSETRRGGRRHTSHIDLDEVDALLKAIDYIANANNSVTKLKEFQVEYRTKGDLAISSFQSTRTGKVAVAVQSGFNPAISANFDLEDLPKIKELIQSALSVLSAAN
jgi:hypothetical protein